MKKKALKVTGTVITGLGESASFLRLDWVDRQLVANLGFSPYPGTLNIDVRDSGVQEELKKAGGRKILPGEAGFCEAVTFAGVIAGKYPCGVVLPLVPNYPGTVLEIVAPVHLKEALQIGDGDTVTVELFLDGCQARA